MNRIQKFFTQIKGLLVHRFFSSAFVHHTWFVCLWFNVLQCEAGKGSGRAFLSLRNKRSDQPRLWKIPIRRNRKKEEISKQVADVYSLKKEYAKNKVDLISSIFDSAIEVNKETDPDEDHKEDEDKKETVKTDAQKVFDIKRKID
ncbi:hypothetical protein RCO48_32725 [Peribacillus frigoritolerans]|nr:hypothetical protein [Peribacillus frigoritolerans]